MKHNSSTWPVLALLPSPGTFRPESDLPTSGQGGVYLLVDDEGEIQYIGQSWDIHERIRTHRREATKPFTRVFWYPVADHSDRLLFESLLILCARPRCNRSVTVGFTTEGRVHDFTKAHYARLKARGKARRAKSSPA